MTTEATTADLAEADRPQLTHGAIPTAVVVGLVVAFVLRVAWVVWLAEEPSSTNSDTGRMLAMARQFADGETYRLNGIVSAFHPAGYPFMLTPLAWLSRVTGQVPLPMAAGLLNACLGTTTVLAGGVLADRVAGRRAAIVAVWILALAPGHIYLTSVALTETAFTTLMLVGLVLMLALRDRAPVATSGLVALGGLIGFTTLVRGQGLFLLPIAWLVLRTAARGPRPWLRTAGALTAGTILVLLPWAVRNGVQVGVWTPSATSNAAFLCHARGPDAVASNEEIPDSNFRRCFVGTPYTPDRSDEARWYGETIDDAIAWTLDNPGEEVRLNIEKTIAMFDGDSQALADARDFDRRQIAGPTVTENLDRLANWWHWAVLFLGIAGLVLVAGVRGAPALWLTVVGMIVSVWGGVAADRYHHTIMALAAVSTAALVTRLVPAGSGAGLLGSTVALAGRAREGIAGAVAEPAAGAPRAAPAPSAGLWAGAALLLTRVGAGLGLAALAFDVVSRLSSTEWVYSRGAWLLLVLVAPVGAAATVALWLALPRSRGPRAAACSLATTAVAATSAWLRWRAGFAFHDPSPLLGTVTTVLVVVGFLWAADTGAGAQARRSRRRSRQ